MLILKGVWIISLAFTMSFGPLWLSFTFYDPVESWIKNKIKKVVKV